jgi:hypothetical protein
LRAGKLFTFVVTDVQEVRTIAARDYTPERAYKAASDVADDCAGHLIADSSRARIADEPAIDTCLS